MTLWPFSKKPAPVLPKPPQWTVDVPVQIGDTIPTGKAMSIPAYGDEGLCWIAEGGKVIWTGSVYEFCEIVRAGARLAAAPVVS